VPRYASWPDRTRPRADRREKFVGATTMPSRTGSLTFGVQEGRKLDEALFAVRRLGRGRRTRMHSRSRASGWARCGTVCRRPTACFAAICRSAAWRPRWSARRTAPAGRTRPSPAAARPRAAMWPCRTRPCSDMRGRRRACSPASASSRDGHGPSSVGGHRACIATVHAGSLEECGRFASILASSRAGSADRLAASALKGIGRP
jgi:hypothetical protein